MATFVQSAASGQGSSPVSVSFGSNVTAGDLLIAMCFSNNNGTMSVNDTQGNTWSPTQAALHGGAFEQVFTAIAKSTGSCTVTLTSTGATVQLLVGEYSAEVFDTQADSSEQSTAQTSFTSASLTPAQTGELGIFMFSTCTGTTCSISTITSGWNIRQNFPGGAGTQVLAYADNLALPSGSQSVSVTLSTSQKPDMIFLSFAPPVNGTNWVSRYRTFVNKH